VGRSPLATSPAFRRYWAGRLASYAGDQIARTALLIAVFDRHGGAAVGWLLLVSTAPRLLGPVLGALADRFDQRRLMVGCDTAQAVIYLAIALAMPSLPVLLGLTALGTGFATLFTPAGRSLIPRLVGTERLPAANAQLAAAVNTGIAAGPALGGLLLAGAGLRATLLVNAATFVLSAALLAAPGFGRRPSLLPQPSPPADPTVPGGQSGAPARSGVGPAGAPAVRTRVGPNPAASGARLGPNPAASGARLGPNPADSPGVPAGSGVGPAAVPPGSGVVAAATPTPHESVLADLRAGLAIAWADRVVRAVALTLLVGVVFAALDNVAVVPFGRGVLHTSDTAVGALGTGYGVGMALAPMLLTLGRSFRAERVLAAGLLSFGAGTALTAVMPALGLALIGQALAGAGNGWQNVANDTLIQQRVPQQRLGTVFGTVYTFPYAAEVLAYAIGGPLLAGLGPRWVLVIAGTGVLGTLAVAYPALSRAVHAGDRPVRAQ
jgi:MFS family permease